MTKSYFTMLSTKLRGESSRFFSPIQVQPVLGLIGGAVLGSIYSPKLAIVGAIIGFVSMLFLTFYEKITENNAAYNRILDQINSKAKAAEKKIEEVQLEVIKEHTRADRLKRIVHKISQDKEATYKYDLLRWETTEYEISDEQAGNVGYLIAGSRSLAGSRPQTQRMYTSHSKYEIGLIEHINLILDLELGPENLHQVRKVLADVQLHASSVKKQPSGETTISQSSYHTESL